LGKNAKLPFEQASNLISDAVLEQIGLGASLSYGQARYVPVILPDCRGVHQAIDVSFVLDAGLFFVPGGQAASGIGTLFSTILLLAADTWC